MYNKIKILFIKSINYYYKIVRLQTRYTGLNLFLNLVVIVLGIISMFLRIDIFSSLSNYPNLKIVLLISGIYYSIFLGLNLSCRVSMVLFKGIPFFYKEIAGEKKVIYYFIGYLILV